MLGHSRDAKRWKEDLSVPAAPGCQGALYLANWAVLSEKSGFGVFPSLTGNMGWEDQNLPVKKFITLGANTGFLCGML